MQSHTVRGLPLTVVRCVCFYFLDDEAYKLAQFRRACRGGLNPILLLSSVTVASLLLKALTNFVEGEFDFGRTPAVCRMQCRFSFFFFFFLLPRLEATPTYHERSSEMVGLGIGRNTPFSQGSDYHTAFNHKYREESGFDPSKQVKVKCSYCGIWARKGAPCSLCGTRAPGGQLELRRSRSPSMTTSTATPSKSFQSSNARSILATISNNTAAPPASTLRRAQSPSLHVDPTATSRQRPVTPVRTTPVEQTVNSMRAIPKRSADDVTFTKKVKCSYCGIWVNVGKMCTLCRTQA